MRPIAISRPRTGSLEWCLSIVVVFAAACAPAARPEPIGDARSPASSSDDSTALEEARATVRSLVGEPTCAAVTECRALPFGAKPCGGPRQYLVFSARRTDSVRLATELARYAQLDARRNRRLGLTSDCALVSRPSLACTADRCVAAPAAAPDR